MEETSVVVSATTTVAVASMDAAKEDPRPLVSSCDVGCSEINSLVTARVIVDELTSVIVSVTLAAVMVIKHERSRIYCVTPITSVFVLFGSRSD